MSKIIANKCDYDLQNDSVLFYIEGKNYYKFSMEFDGIVLDFDQDDEPINLEILDASKKFNVSKPALLHIKHFNADIEINEEDIKVTMKLEVLKRNKLIPTILNALTPNILKLPSVSKGIAVTC